MKILIYYGKHGDEYWLADTPTRVRQSLRALFILLDEMGCYEGDIKDTVLTKARNGDTQTIDFILNMRCDYEYEGWEFENINVPSNGNLPGIAELEGFNAYQVVAHGTAVYPPDAGIMYASLGLAGEAGEIANKVKKIIRDDGGKITTERKAALLKELGDALWYSAEIATILGADLSDVAQANLNNLYGRKKRGTLKGDGDNR